MNPRPKAYESSALPLSYSGRTLIIDDLSLSAVGQVKFDYATTVADAVAARQVLKSKIKSGKFQTPAGKTKRNHEESDVVILHPATRQNNHPFFTTKFSPSPASEAPDFAGASLPAVAATHNPHPNGPVIIGLSAEGTPADCRARPGHHAGNRAAGRGRSITVLTGFAAAPASA